MWLALGGRVRSYRPVKVSAFNEEDSFAIERWELGGEQPFVLALLPVEQLPLGVPGVWTLIVSATTPHSDRASHSSFQWTTVAAGDRIPSRPTNFLCCSV